MNAPSNPAATSEAVSRVPRHATQDAHRRRLAQIASLRRADRRPRSGYWRGHRATVPAADQATSISPPGRPANGTRVPRMEHGVTGDRERCSLKPADPRSKPTRRSLRRSKQSTMVSHSSSPSASTSRPRWISFATAPAGRPRSRAPRSTSRCPAFARMNFWLTRDASQLAWWVSDRSSLEFSAPHGGVEDRTGPCHRLQRRPETSRGHAAQCLALGGTLRLRPDSRRARS